MILQSLHTPQLNLVIRGDINVNCHSYNDRRNQLDALLNHFSKFLERQCNQGY